MILRQTWALFIDAYRELNARKMFWLSLGVSGLVVAAFAALGINEQGITILWWQGPDFINTSIVPADVFYKFVFVNFGVGLWLSWAALILALASTAGIFPDLVTRGSIDLMLSRPIGRLRLFLTKYVLGLLFVVLQATVFSTACLLVIGVRGGEWLPGLLLAVPLVAVVFSYLFCVMALLGVVTRSTVAALLLTLGFWFLVFAIDQGETITLFVKSRARITAEAVAKQVEVQREQIAQERARLGGAGGAGEVGEAKGMDAETLAKLEEALARREAEADDRRVDARYAARWHAGFYAPKAVLPKTSETTALLRRALMAESELEWLENLGNREGGPPRRRQRDMAEVQAQKAAVDEVRGRSLWWVLGTSLGFQAAVVGLAAAIFSRRDF